MDEPLRWARHARRPGGGLRPPPALAMNRGLKTILRRNWVKTVLCAMIAGYIRLVYATSRWRIEGGEIPGRLWDAKQPFILAFWHGRLMMMPFCWRRGVPIGMLISHHPDGQFISRTVSHFQIDTIIGSSSRGGAAALRTLMKSLSDGTSIGITPDGPRGPRMRASLGVIQTARLAGVPILPCAYGVARRRILSSWDRFILALPFSRGVIVWGEPLSVPRDASDSAVEEARQMLESRLIAITEAADRQCGVTPVAPAAPRRTAKGNDDDDDAPVTSQAMAGRS